MSGFQNALNAYTGLQEVSDKRRADSASLQAGNMLAGGDYTGAANSLYKGGYLEQGGKVQAVADARHKAEAEGTLRLVNGMAQMIQGGADPQTAWATARQFAQPNNVDLAQFDALKPHFDQDYKSFIAFTGEHAKKELVKGENGELGTWDGTNYAQVRAGTRKPPHGQWVERRNADGSSSRVWLTDPTDDAPGGNAYGPPGLGTATQDTQGNAVPPPPAPPSEAPTADGVWAAMKQRESGGNGNAVSPQGAIGSTQMLPATAQAMARKLGVQWRPDLMQGNSPEALQYQDQLGRAYFDEGLQRYGGDTSKAAMYYHGGPNTAIWGPKTRAYAQAVTGGRQQVAASGGQNPPMQGGAGRDTMQPGAREIAWDAAPAPKAAKDREAPAGYRFKADGNMEFIPGGPADPAGAAKPNKPLTEYQGKSIELLNAAFGGNDRLNELASKGIYKPRTATDSLFHNEKDGTPRLVLRTEEDRQFVQAAKEWLAPILRKESGASVTDGELATYMDIYIPKFEDSQQVMFQKAQARDKKMSSIYTANKGAYDATFGAPPKWRVLTLAPPGKAPAQPSAPSGWSMKRVR